MNKFNPYSDEQTKELIHLTAERLGFQDPSVVEKDLYVTKAIGVLTGVVNKSFRLVFQGGTALAKAHGCIKRMSEDCDFRVVLKEKEKKMGKDHQRKLLRGYRNELLKALSDSGFVVSNDAVSVRNEGRFICIKVAYPSVYNIAKTLKPYISLELFLTG